MSALGCVREVYGVRQISFNEAKRTVKVEYDISRLAIDDIAALLRGAGLDVASHQQDRDSTISVYGKDVTFQSVLKGKVPTPDVARDFMKAVTTAAHKARVEEAREGEKK